MGNTSTDTANPSQSIFGGHNSPTPITTCSHSGERTTGRIRVLPNFQRDAGAVVRIWETWHKAKHAGPGRLTYHEHKTMCASTACYTHRAWDGWPRNLAYCLACSLAFSLKHSGTFPSSASTHRSAPCRNTRNLQQTWQPQVAQSVCRMHAG